MDYQKHYNLLISRAKDRQLSGYAEVHHIVPKCMGGGNEQSNLAKLTPEEHFLAHQLLIKIYPNERKLVFAAWAMCRGINRNNKRYGWLRRAQSEAQKGTKLSAEARKKISAARTGTKLTPEAAKRLHDGRKAAGTSDEHRAKLSAALKGKPKSDKAKAALKAYHAAKVWTPEDRAKMAANKGKKLNQKQRDALLKARLGIPLTDECKAKISAANKGKKRNLIQCPHCDKLGGAGIMKRWHFDNCRAVEIVIA
jgi:hypothetical protein